MINRHKTPSERRAIRKHFVGNQFNKSFLYNEKAEAFKNLYKKLILKLGSEYQVRLATNIHVNVQKMLFDENKISVEQAGKLLNAYKRIIKSL